MYTEPWRRQHADYMQEIGNKLVKQGEEETNNSARPSTSTDRLSARHFPEKIPHTSKKQTPTRVCKDKGKVQTGKIIWRESSYFCRPCDVGLSVLNASEHFIQNKNIIHKIIKSIKFQILFCNLNLFYV